MSSFGGFGGFGQNNNNNNNQQQQQSSGFGGFGANANNNNNTTGGFGTPANTGFGATNNTTSSLFGGGAATGGGFGSSGFGATTANTGFGAPRPAFGSPAAGTSTTNSLFGSGNTNTASTGFGGFGATAQTNTTGFGSAANTGGGSLFGGASNNTGFGAGAANTGFGSSTAVGFGNTPAATGFGAAASNGFGASTQAQNQGTGGTPFQAHIEKDGTANQNAHYQSMTFQQPYVNYSFEELRVADYMQGRKYGNTNGQAGAFGTATGFGGQPATGGFGSSTTGGSLFGQSNATGFGQTAPATGFGASANTGGFGAPKPAPLFGSAATPAVGSSGFGASNPSSGFGSNNTSNAFGSFGQTNNQVKPLFGAPAPAATGGFGTPATTTGFGSTANTGGGIFGQNNNNQTQSPFGTQPAQNNTGFGGFGANNNTAQTNSSPFGGFGGNNQTAAKPLFGAPAAGTGFGNSNTTTQNSLFGGAQSNNGSSNSLFAPKPTTSSNLFGSTTQNNAANGSNPFGGLGNQQQQNSGLNPFGNANNQPNKNMFGGSANATPNLFGGLTQNNNNQQQQNGGLFGNSMNNNQQQLNNSLFGNSLANSQQQQGGQQLTTSIMAQNPYGNEHLFVSLANTPQSVGPLATPLSSNQKARKPAPLPSYRINPAASSRLITPQKRTGYGFSYSTYGTPGSAYGSPALGQSLLGGSAFNGTLARSASASSLRSYGAGDSILNPNAFSASPMRSLGGSGGMKKLRIDRSIRNDFFGTDGASDAAKPSPLKKIVSFDNEATSAKSLPDESTNANGTSTALVRTEESNSAEPSPEEQGLLRSSRSEKEKAPAPSESPDNDTHKVQGNELAIVPEDGSPPPPPTRPNVGINKQEAARLSQKDQVPGNYYMKPSKAELEKMSRSQLSQIKGFVVGREGVGYIVFHQPDLTSVPLDRICGDIVKLGTRSATVYLDPQGKPPVGKGLNVPSTVTLGNSWARSDAGTLPVYERKGPRYDKHIIRLKRVTATKFVEYKPNTGEWIFDVDHFSTYKLDYSEDLDMNDAVDGLVDYRSSRTLPGAFDAEMDFDMMPTGHNNGATFNNLHSNGPIPTQELGQDGPHTNSNAVTIESTAISAPIVDTLSNSFEAPNTPARAPTKSILKTSMATFGTPLRKPLIDADWNEQLSRTISPKKQDRRLLRESQGPMLKELYRSKPASSILDRETHPFATSIDVMKSLFGNNMTSSEPREKKQGPNENGLQWPRAKKLKADDTMTETDRAFHASFKPSWATDATLIHTAESTASRPQDGVLADGKESLATRGNGVRFAGFPSNVATSSTFEKLKELSNVKIEQGVPIAQLSNTFAFSDVAKAIKDSDVESSHEKRMWELAAILFDENAGDEEFDEDMSRKEKLSEFWQDLVKPRALEQVQMLKEAEKKEERAEERAIAHLSSFNVWDASEALLQGKDFRLATMIAQIGGDDTSKQAMADQIEEWRRSNVISEMTLPIRALYELLAGNTCESKGKTGAGTENKAATFNIGVRFNLDWRQVFGMKLWYGHPAMGPIQEAIADYNAELANVEGQVRPLPWFVDTAGENDEREDILWGLLKLFDDKSNTGRVGELGEIISPDNLSSNSIDARLPFQLYQFLQARSIADFKSEHRDPKADLLATDYAFQLSTSPTASPTTFCDAVFVTLHISTPATRRTAIEALLNRHAGSIGNSPASCPTFQTLINDLKIPASWIWIAKALHAKSVLRDQAMQIRCLLRAGEAREAHEVLRKVVAPRAVIEEDLDALRSLIAAFKEVRGTNVEGWQQGGGVYSDFAKLEASKDQSERDLLMDRLEAVLPGMMKLGVLEERAAVREMMDVVERMKATTGDARPVLSIVGSDNDVYVEAVRLSDEYYARLVSAS